MSSIAVIDYGMGNLRSVAKALGRVASGAVQVLVTQRAEDILAADRVVFPGQGAIKSCIDELERLALVDVVKTAAANKPFLGLCLGPQALMDFSEENGGTHGLGIVSGCVKGFSAFLRNNTQRDRIKVPHMGWNQVHQTYNHPLWRGISQDSRFYFVHSYYLEPATNDITAGVSCYALEFASAIFQDNIFAVQFHPEKSAQAGLQLLANFVCWRPS